MKYKSSQCECKFLKEKHMNIEEIHITTKYSRKVMRSIKWNMHHGATLNKPDKLHVEVSAGKGSGKLPQKKAYFLQCDGIWGDSLQRGTLSKPDKLQATISAFCPIWYIVV